MNWIVAIGAALVVTLLLLAWLGPERVPRWAQPVAAALAAALSIFVLIREPRHEDDPDLAHGHPLSPPDTSDLEEAATGPTLDHLEAASEAASEALALGDDRGRVDELAGLVDRTGSP